MSKNKPSLENTNDRSFSNDEFDELLESKCSICGRILWYDPNVEDDTPEPCVYCIKKTREIKTSKFQKSMRIFDWGSILIGFGFGFGLIISILFIILSEV